MDKPWYETITLITTIVATIAGICTILGVSVFGGKSLIKDKTKDYKITTKSIQDDNQILNREQSTESFASDYETKKEETNQNLYKYVKYRYEDVWNFDTEWTDDVISVDDTCKLYAKRTLYHGQRKYTEEQITYKHKKDNEDGTEDIVWTGSKTSPKGYEYANEINSKKTIKYENLGKWVTSEPKLGEYSFNVVRREQYKYRRKVQKKIVDNVIWESEENAPEGYEKSN